MMLLMQPVNMFEELREWFYLTDLEWYYLREFEWAIGSLNHSDLTLGATTSLSW